MTEIVYNTIWLGNAADADDERFLLGKQITHVVNVGGDLAQSEKMLPHVRYYKIDALDMHGYPILERHLFVFSKIMDEALLNPHNKILVHCQAGINRSTTLLIAYLKKLYPGVNLIELVKSLRPIVLSNKSFLSVLQSVEDFWAQQVGSNNSMS